MDDTLPSDDSSKLDFFMSPDAGPSNSESWKAPRPDNVGGGSKTPPKTQLVEVPQTDPNNKVFMEVIPGEHPELFKHRPPTELQRRIQQEKEARQMDDAQIRLDEMHANALLATTPQEQFGQAATAINERLSSATEKERPHLILLRNTINRLNVIASLPENERQSAVGNLFNLTADTAALRLKDATTFAKNGIIEENVKAVLSRLANGSELYAKHHLPESYQRQVDAREKSMSRAEIIDERMQEVSPAELNAAREKLSEERIDTTPDDLIVSLMDTLGMLKGVSGNPKDAEQLFKRLNWLKEEEISDVKRRIDFRFGNAPIGQALNVLVDEAAVQRALFLENKAKAKPAATQSTPANENDTSVPPKENPPAPPAKAINIYNNPNSPLRELQNASPGSLAETFTPSMQQLFLGHILHNVDESIEQARRIAIDKGKDIRLGKYTLAQMLGAGDARESVYQRAYYAKTGELLTPTQIGTMPMNEFLTKVFGYDLSKDAQRAEELKRRTNALWSSQDKP